MNREERVVDATMISVYRLRGVANCLGLRGKK